MTTIDLFSQTPRDIAIDALHAATALYTTEPVVDELLHNLNWPNGERKLVDPSCGDGMFLVRALDRLFLVEPSINDGRLTKLIEGWEIHPYAASQARVRVADALVKYGRGGTRAAGLASQLVHTADFLASGPTEPTYHAIAGNPPYLRFVNVPDLLRADYRSLLPAHARSDLLHSFLDRCAKAMFSDGEIALVTAGRWLFNQGSAGLRAVLGERFAIDRLERLDATTAFYRPKQRRAGTPPRIHPVAVVMRKPSEKSIRLSRAPIYPGVTAADQEDGLTLGDIADVRIAPWVGSPGVFVVDSATAKGLPAEYLVPAVDTDDIVDGVLQRPKRFAIRTVPGATPAHAIMEHLRINLHRMAARGRKRKEIWLPPETWHRVPLDRPALLVPRIARSLRPVRLPPGVLPINHNLHIVAAGGASLEAIETYLSSDKAGQWVRTHAAPLESGFYSLTTTLLRRLPIPRIDGVTSFQP